LTTGKSSASFLRVATPSYNNLAPARIRCAPLVPSNLKLARTGIGESPALRGARGGRVNGLRLANGKRLVARKTPEPGAGARRRCLDAVQPVSGLPTVLGG